jgi:predicted MFS family arabinose efflux permease
MKTIITRTVWMLSLVSLFTDVASAWITNICEKEKTATAIGTYTAFQSIATLIASSLAGIIWYSFGPTVVFMTSAIVATGVAFYISKTTQT